MDLTSSVLLLSCLWQLSQALCVLEVGVGNLGMSVNCRFKKSSIVRVRNLGGIKGYIDLGLSLGDEMGFSPTFSQTEQRRRSAKRANNVTEQVGQKRPATADSEGALRLMRHGSSHRKVIGNTGNNTGNTGNAGNTAGNAGNTAGNTARSAATSQAFRMALRAAADHFKDVEVMSTGEPSTEPQLPAKLAPREYFPLGYPDIPGVDAKAAADLHLTAKSSSFRCERQKFLPGLYADPQLGCRVFHACLDVGKASGSRTHSYWCPAYTLFDQAVLRCNWWFYVDCGASEKLYASNAPIAKTYRLVKSLFFPIENEA